MSNTLTDRARAGLDKNFTWVDHDLWLDDIRRLCDKYDEMHGVVGEILEQNGLEIPTP
jgi:hypothetical protein